MKTFIFIVVVPVITGIITAANGASYFVPEQLQLAMAINLPVCALSAFINVYLE